MDVQSAANLTIPEGSVRNIHDKDKRLLWSAVGYNVRYDGDTTQQTYSGKNLFNKNATVVASSWATTASPLTTGVRVTQLVSSIASDYRWVLYTVGNTSDYVGKTLTLYAKATASSTNKPRVLIGLCNADGSGVGGSVLGDDFPATVSKSITQSDADSKAKIFVAFYASAGAVSPANAYVDYTDVQLEVGSTATSYEPYVGGIPAPNPDYPQTVNVVTGTQTVGINGKNLFKIGSTQQSSNGVTFTPHDDGTFDIVGKATSTASFSVVMPLVGSGILGGGKYKPSTNSSIGNSSVRYYVHSCTQNGGWRKTLMDLNNTNVITCADPIEDYLNFVIVVGNGNTVNLKNVKFQLEKGETATSFVKYVNGQNYTIGLGDTELCKIGTFQDYIYKSGDDWYIHKEIRGLVLDGSEENWGRQASQTARSIFYLPVDDIEAYTNANSMPRLISNRFIPATYNATWVPGDISRYTNKSDIRFVVWGRTELTYFKTWLASNNVVVYYVLATPTNTKITDSTLVSQLNAIHDWLTRYDYYGNVTGNLPIIINRTGLI